MAESRATGTTWTMVSEAATLEAVKRGRPLGDATPITIRTLWDRVGEDMAAKPYKALGVDLLREARQARDMAIDTFIAQSHRLQTFAHEERKCGGEARLLLQADAVRTGLPRHIAALYEALRRNFATAGPRAAEDHLRQLRVEAELARRKLEGVPPAPRPSRSSPSAGF